MDFISGGMAVSTALLLSIGFCVGVCGGFFGIGGAFIVTPALNVLGFPMVYAIGTDLAHMAGKSVIATIRHRRLGHVDFRAAMLLLVGTLPGVRLGTETILMLEKVGKTDLYVRYAYIVLLFTLGLFMLREVRKKQDAGAEATGLLNNVRIPPMVSLPQSGIRCSIWAVIGIGLFTGFLAGFLGVGGGFIRMPALMYILGMPTKIAVGTDLVEVLFSGAYGSYLYGKAGHVDIVAALIMLVGASIGSQIGATATQYVESTGIRKLFAYTVLGTGVAVVMKQLHFNTASAVILFSLGMMMTAAIIRQLYKALTAN